MNGQLYSVRSLEEIEALKRDWLGDPCWDIEKTEGFEAWHIELAAWRQHYEAEWQMLEIARLEQKAAKLGCSVNMVEYIETLERQIEALQKQVTS